MARLKRGEPFFSSYFAEGSPSFEQVLESPGTTAAVPLERVQATSGGIEADVPGVGLWIVVAPATKKP
jgi:hypothetical protein